MDLARQGPVVTVVVVVHRDLKAPARRTCFAGLKFNIKVSLFAAGQQARPQTNPFGPRGPEGPSLTEGGPHPCQVLTRCQKVVVVVRRCSAESG